MRASLVQLVLQAVCLQAARHLHVKITLRMPSLLLTAYLARVCVFQEKSLPSGETGFAHAVHS